MGSDHQNLTRGEHRRAMTPKLLVYVQCHLVYVCLALASLGSVLNYSMTDLRRPLYYVDAPNYYWSDNSWRTTSETDVVSNTNLGIHESLPESPPLHVQHKISDQLFLKGRELNGLDTFSASWWERTERFLEFNPSVQIHSVEDDAFKPIQKAGKGHHDVRMTHDLLDFSVEHLSQWWKYAGRDTLAYAHAKLDNYTARIRSQPKLQDNYMNTTIAVIPYGVKDKTDAKSKGLWAAALAGTMTSLLNHGIARIIIVGHYKTDETLVRRVFGQLLESKIDNSDYDEKDRHFETRIGASEVAFVHTDNVNSTLIRQNIPKGALVGLQDALAGRSDNAVKYLGRAPVQAMEHFQFVFLTEADQILNARITPEFLTEMQEQNGIIIPHRLQPMPHPQDLQGLRLARHMNSLPGHKDVVALDAAKGDGCCDTGYHQEGYTKVCTSKWFQCDYFPINATFHHLDEYDFMSLTQGMGIVLLAGNQHSRQCIPRKSNNKMKNAHGVC